VALSARVLIAPVLLVAVLVTPVASHGHELLEPQAVQRLLADISRSRRESREAHGEDMRLDALYQLGQSVRDLVELLNHDTSAHGTGDAFAKLVARRLQEYGLGVTFAEDTRRYQYDFAAFHEYLRRAQRGPRAGEIRYRLIADTFYRTLSTDSATLLRGSAEALIPAVADAERFLEDFPNDPRAKEVRLFRATDYYRLFRSARDPVTARRYAEFARQALREVLARHGGTPEARAAEGLLEQLPGSER
jgi:hypothetical protein